MCLDCVPVFCSLSKRLVVLLVAISDLVVYFMKSVSVLFSNLCVVFSSHFFLSCSVLCCSLCCVSWMLCLWWSIVMSSRTREASVRVFSQCSLSCLSR